MLLVNTGKYLGFCAYRRSYLLWFPVILQCSTGIDSMFNVRLIAPSGTFVLRNSDVIPLYRLERDFQVALELAF